MSTSIPARSVAFVESLIASGAYDSADAVVAAALLSFEQQRKIDHLRAELLPAIEQLDRGEYVELSSEDEIDGYFDRLAAEASSRDHRDDK